jgi:hypothetical protein
MRTLFLAWQDPDRRRWYPVGRLTSSGGLYTFVYTKGAEQAHAQAGFQPLASFPELLTAYISDNLFPLFTNRVLPQTRPEYAEFVQWLSLPMTEHDPIGILARSGGRKVTDSLEVFPEPERDVSGKYLTHFLLHGLSHMPESAVQRASRLSQGETLLVMRDFQNPRDPEAIALRTAETFEHDLYIVGYVPRYLRGDILKLMNLGSSPEVVVQRVNPSPAPVQYRVLCKAVMPWPEGFEPFSEGEYQPLVPDSAAMDPISLPPHHYGP